jgi:tight adherence protein C
MTFLLALIGVLMVATSGRLLAHAVALPRLRLRRHLSDIRDYGFSSGSASEEVASTGHLKDAVRRLAERVGRFTMANVVALHPLERGQLAAAGFYDIDPETVHGYRGLAAASLAVVVGSFGFLIVGLSLITVALVAAGAALGWQLPAVVIGGRGSRRLTEIDKEMPELIDLLIATVEAGMGFGGSLKLVADRLQGALGDEVRLTVRQQNLGISTSEALEDMLERCDSQSMRAFVRTVVRGESMGLSIAPILRELTTDMRRRRRQATQERMHKAPVKILFPLMFLIMPALMIVLFYPAAYSVMGGMSGLGGH